ncbi:uncharacterized protein VICG_01386 [Vittaforma corneae ATCC 50505]|uniref:DNA recombination and repair protein Rad51-like C-terminal domain-containing protein n=1 Tax=Vittaforma corneae (strain ATCC 50505) TaxID=993615 RepID=L2GMJ0_VITCO|nr:uncharacterized protein VICG_01386 [Vittaforma corneae ATCC 50505]ELA41522.1 hypothetical protein VICG_01386 [Vittaforma corneae ATCC 50505]
MLEVKGIIEIVGDSAVGKTALAIYIKKELKTLYICSRISKKGWFPEHFIIERIDSFLGLKVFIAKDLKRIVNAQKIEKIILDGLEDYLYIIEKPRKHSNEIFRIVKILKYLYFAKNVSIIIINNSYGKWEVDGVRIANNYFGLPWEYMINARYLVSRIYNQRWVGLVTGNTNIHKRFYIDDLGLHFED